MLAKKLEENGGKGKFDEPMDKLMLRLDAATFSRAQSSESVILRVYCPESRAALNFTLANMDNKRKGRDGMVLDLQLDQETFMGIVNPKLKVIFQYENILAPFATLAMARGSLFAAHPPMTDMAN